MKRFVLVLFCACLLTISLAGCNSSAKTVSTYFGLDNDTEYPVTFETGTGKPGSIVAERSFVIRNEIRYLAFTFIPPTYNKDGEKIVELGLPANAPRSVVSTRPSPKGHSYATFRFDTSENETLYGDFAENVLRHLKAMVLYLTPIDREQTAF